MGEARPKPAPSLPRIKHPPQRSIAILGEQQRAVGGLGHIDRAAPDFCVVDDEAGDEILLGAGRLAVFKTQADDLVAGAAGAVP